MNMQIENVRVDGLTGLPARGAFDAHLSELANSDCSLSAVIAMEISNFGSLNARFGAVLGDKVLKTVAKRLQKLLPDANILARLNGDSFIATFEELDELEAISDKLIDFLRRPYFANGEVLVLGTRLGIATATGQASVSNAELVDRAEIALHHGNKRDQLISVYDDSMRKQSKASYRLEHDLRATLLLATAELHSGAPNEHFEVRYTPLYSTGLDQTGQLAELVWKQADSPIDSSALIDIARGVGAAELLIDWQVMRVAEEMRFQSNPIATLIDLPVFKSLSLVDFSNKLLDAVAKSEVNQALLGVMVSYRPETRDLTRDLLRQLKSCGYEAAIRNFGSTYAPVSDLYTLNASAIHSQTSVESDPKYATALQAFADAYGVSLIVNTETTKE